MGRKVPGGHLNLHRVNLRGRGGGAFGETTLQTSPFLAILIEPRTLGRP